MRELTCGLAWQRLSSASSVLGPPASAGDRRSSRSSIPSRSRSRTRTQPRSRPCFPRPGARAIEIMMAVWSPGFYRVEDYARRVEELSAKASRRHRAESRASREESLAGRDRRQAEGRRQLPAHLPAVVGDDRLRRRRLRRFQRCGDVHHAGRASPAAARSAVRAAAGVETDDDCARAVGRRPAQPLSGR